MATYYGIPTSDRIANLLETSGVGNGARFDSADEVRDYFTPESFQMMFGEAQDDADTLAEVAEFVIAHHTELTDICAF